MLCSQIFLRIVDSSKNDSTRAASVMLYLGCLLTFAMMPIVPDEALKAFIFSAIISLVVIYKNLPYLKAHKKQLILPGALLAFGLMQVIWVALFKEPGSAFTGAYRAYQNGGKILIFASLIVTALSCPSARQLRGNNAMHYFIIVIGSALYGYAAWQVYDAGEMKLTSFRVELGYQFATTTAYALTFIALIVSQAIINLRFKWTIAFYLLHFAISLAAIISTQTRAAILVYPLLSMSLFFIHFRHNKKLLIRSLFCFLAFGCAAFMLLKPILEKRYADLQYDLSSYSKKNSNTSVGARFAMQQAGIFTGMLHPLGQSLEARSHGLNKLIKTTPSFKSVLPFKKTHFHNELVDTFSLKGIPGVILLISVYAAMIYTSRRECSIILLYIALTITIYGLSDTLLYDKSGTLNCMLSLCLALMITPQMMREQCHE
ncbi:O-antigen ligase family protein [Enterobacteriaceae bacterium 4M9]|nr:O-antigen ligase family protein [Enterobacteriaceae bacterium 4M9]